MYRFNYQLTHDIDWFCKIKGIPVHLASNGGLLPGRSYTIQGLVDLQHKVANMDRRFQCDINTEYIDEYLRQGEFYGSLGNLSEEDYRILLPERFEMTNDIIEQKLHILVYSWSFIEMAKRGFFSFDRKVGEENVYHLVAWPKDLVFDEFNDDVFRALKEYNACCFPPCHKDYYMSFPDCIRFDVDSLSKVLRDI